MDAHVLKMCRKQLLDTVHRRVFLDALVFVVVHRCILNSNGKFRSFLKAITRWLSTHWTALLFHSKWCRYSIHLVYRYSMSIYLYLYIYIFSIHIRMSKPIITTLSKWPFAISALAPRACGRRTRTCTKRSRCARPGRRRLVLLSWAPLFF